MKNKPQQTLKTKEQFIKFFQKIPKSRWTTCGLYASEDNKRFCAFGHVRRIDAKTGGELNEINLAALVRKGNQGQLTEVNDKRSGLFQQRSAKDRVIAFLKKLP